MRKKTEEERLAKIKGPGPLPKAERLPTAIYLPFATHSVSLMEHGCRERQTHTTRRLDNNDIPNSPKGGTFRQTYGFVVLGWALGYNPSHFITPDAATATVCLRAHTQTPSLAETATFNRQMSKSFIIAHAISTTAFGVNFKVYSMRKKWCKRLRDSYDMQCNTGDERILIAYRSQMLEWHQAKTGEKLWSVHLMLKWNETKN